MKNKREYIKKVPILCEGSSAKNRGNRLKRLRTFANLTRKEMASPDSGISIYSLKSWETGRFGGMPRDGAEKVIKQVAKRNIKCSLEWLLHGTGEPPAGTLKERDETK